MEETHLTRDSDPERRLSNFFPVVVTFNNVNLSKAFWDAFSSPLHWELKPHALCPPDLKEVFADLIFYFPWNKKLFHPSIVEFHY